MGYESSIRRRLNGIKLLAKKYFELNKGDLVERPDQLLRVTDIKHPVNSRHPHYLCRIYISRRSLKHFVEERKAAFLKNHSEKVTFEAICFAIDSIPDVIIDFDRYEHEPKEVPSKHFYTKHYGHAGRPSVRILTEYTKDALEIRSMHFQTRNVPK